MSTGSSSSVGANRHRHIQHALFSTGTLAQSPHAVVGAGDCEHLQAFKKKDDDTTQESPSKSKPSHAIKDTVERSEMLEAPHIVAETLKQSYRIQAFLKNRDTALETDYASSNWSVYQQNMNQHIVD